MRTSIVTVEASEIGVIFSGDIFDVPQSIPSPERNEMPFGLIGTNHIRGELISAMYQQSFTGLMIEVFNT